MKLNPYLTPVIRSCAINLNNYILSSSQDEIDDNQGGGDDLILDPWGQQ